MIGLAATPSGRQRLDAVLAALIAWAPAQHPNPRWKCGLRRSRDGTRRAEER
jgi:hypothetical protein